MDDPRVHWRDTNLRELGGYGTPHGPVKRGAFYRGGRMDELSTAGHAVYAGLGLHTIIDLRRDDEVTANPTPAFGDERNVQLSVSTGSTAFAEAAALADDPSTAGQVLETASHYYRVLVSERLPLWKPVFDTVFAAEGAPVLFHCTAGKDRTGFLAAAILKFLDVDDETVYDDYVYTNEVRKPWIDQRVAERHAMLATERGVGITELSPDHETAWRALMGAPREWLEATFATVNEVYGDWHTMRREGLGISDDRLATWRASVVDAH